jgi:hypothetical protein
MHIRFVDAVVKEREFRNGQEDLKRSNFNEVHVRS